MEEITSLLLDSIASEVSSCNQCGLCQSRTNTVPGEGDPNARIMIVGEGPGEQEDLQGRPFVGPAGNLLDLALVTAQLGRGHVFIANTVKCRPPGNRNPTKEEMDACFPFLKQQIETIQPDLIIALGKVAAEYLLDRQVKITKEHGELDFLPTGGCVMIVLHPAYVLRNQKDEVKQSFFDAFNGARQIVYGV